MNNVILCGFMGCGKSTVGCNIARKTGRRFIDMDRYIEQKAGMRVSEIFAVAVFRGKDKIVLLDVPLRVIKNRLRNDTKRPLLQRPDKDEAMARLYKARLPQYRAAADVTIKGESTPLKTAYAVIHTLGLKK